MKKPLLIGLPATCKTTYSRLIAKKLNFEIISTDILFRKYRAIPLDSNKFGVEIMRNFLSCVEKQSKEIYTKILPEAEKGKLGDSKLFRSFGEDIFRLYEIEMNKWLNKNGKFDNKIVDLSASALLYEENRNLFSAKNGYTKILLDVNTNIILSRLLKDYKQYLENSKNAGKKMPIRGAYEIAAENAIKNGGTAIEGLQAQLEKDKNYRIEKYKKYSDKIIKIDSEIPKEQICEIILKKL